MSFSHPYQGRRFPDFSLLTCLKLVLAACSIAFLSLGAHDLAIAHLGIPYPDSGGVPAWAKLAGVFLRIGATVYFCRLASWYLDQRSTVTAALIMGALVVFFHETFRVIVVDNVMVDGWIDCRWIYMVLKRLPDACVNFFWGAVAVVIARRVVGRQLMLIAAAVLASSLVSYFLIRPGIAAACGMLVDALHMSEPPEVWQMPYNFYVYKYIYGGFIEPAIAMFVMVWLAWPGLQGTPARRIAIFAFVTLMMRGRVIGTFVYCFWSNQPLGTAIAAYGQFFVETLILVTLTAYVWSLVVKDVSARRAAPA
jgi:hypothetical protein